MVGRNTQEAQKISLMSTRRLQHVPMAANCGMAQLQKTITVQSSMPGGPLAHETDAQIKQWERNIDRASDKQWHSNRPTTQERVEDAFRTLHHSIAARLGHRSALESIAVVERLSMCCLRIEDA